VDSDCDHKADRIVVIAGGLDRPNGVARAGLGLARLKKDGWIEGSGPGSRLQIQVHEPSTTHSLTVSQLHHWIDSVTKSPAEVLRRARVKQLLGS